MQQLLRDCGISSVYAKKDDAPRNVNVFDSSSINGLNDPDLGAPNRNCPIPGPGIGSGGVSTAPYHNCDPQGNLLIIQSTDYAESKPNDSMYGGCMYIIFEKEVTLYNMGLLDMEEPMTITVCFLITSFLHLNRHISASHELVFTSFFTTTGHRK
jgi:hypothetical protein